jgi:hypothetical protein
MKAPGLAQIAHFDQTDGRGDDHGSQGSVRQILKAIGVGCLVTEREHLLLNKIDRPFRARPGGTVPNIRNFRFGLKRYEEAHIEVFDRLTVKR